jgi:type VI secretion system secreted protein Hcp
MAQVAYFLKIDGIDGEAQDSKHKNEIEIDSFSWGAENKGSSSGGSGGGTGRSVMQDIQFTARHNKSSPKLFLACATGEHIKKAVLTATKAGKDQQDYLKWVFSDVLVSSYTTNGSPGDIIPMDHFAFNFTKIETEYKPQKADGSLDSAVNAGWNTKENKKV